MAIDLTKQRLYSLRLAVPEDNRYPYGAFNAYYSNQVFYASTRPDLKDLNIYHYIYDNDHALESNITIFEMAWFVAYLYYDENRLLDTELSFMELMTDITNYSKQLSDLPPIPDGYTLKWNIYGVVPYDEFRIKNGSYLKDDYVYKTNNGSQYYIIKANTNDPDAMGWNFIYDINANELYPGVEMEDFVYDMLSNPKCQVVGDFVEGDRIIDIEESSNGDPTNFIEKYSCNEFRVYMDNLIFDDKVYPLSNVYIQIAAVEDYTSPTDGNTTYILATDLEDGYYHFTLENDGVYIVTVFYNDDILYQEYIFAACNVENCIQSLLNSIYCNDNDCCSNCDEDFVKEIEFKRNELNKLMLFLNVISNTINYARVSYTGRVVLDSELHSNMERAGEWWTRVEEIIDRCGTCGESLTNTGGCSQC